jgi:8-oxo-dGTP pyrophosphatase MutT (NUDIX family)
VASCFIENNDKILLLHRQDSKPQGDTWGMPAGKIDSGEDVYDAVLREISEETGLNILKPDIKYYKKLCVRYKEYDFVYYIFNTKYEKTPEIIINKKEHKEYGWFTPKEALKLKGIEGLDKCIKMFYF